MAMALCMAQRSPDPATQVGCVICDQDYRLISCGYNGTPKGIHPKSVPWDKEGEPGKTKYEYVIHAERNAIDNATASAKEGICYITLQPCHSCAAGIIQAGIREVVYLDDKYKDMWFTKLGLEMLERVDIVVRKHKWSKHYDGEI
jgi:dCMP deaminase